MPPGMTKGNRGEPPSVGTCAASVSRRKHSTYREQSLSWNCRKKRQKVASNSESLTQTTYLPRVIPDSNRFETIGSSSRTVWKKREKRIREDSRKWVFSARDYSSYKHKIMVVSYNILGVENASKHPNLYLKVPPQIMEWDRRRKLIKDELSHYNASILCFQEVDRFNDLDSFFQKDGYRGVYKARTGEAHDGCAIFWKEKLFTLLHQENIEFQSFDLRHNVAQLCVLKMNQTQSESDLCNIKPSTQSIESRSLLVGNIHVLFNPNRGDIKLGQVRLFLEKAYKLSQEWGSIPVIIAGDLNSIPKSAIYQFLASSELDVQLHDRRKMSGLLEFNSHGGFRYQKENAAWHNSSRPLLYEWSEEELRIATGKDCINRVQHHLKLSSAYTGVPGSCKTRDIDGEPLVTSYHSKFMGTVDYIWHSKELVPVRVLDTLPIDQLRRTGGIPTKKWGSDHLALACEFTFADDDDGT